MPHEIKLADDVKLLLEKEAQEKSQALSEIINEHLRERLTIRTKKTIIHGGIYNNSSIHEPHSSEELTQQLIDSIPSASTTDRKTVRL